MTLIAERPEHAYSLSSLILKGGVMNNLNCAEVLRRCAGRLVRSWLFVGLLTSLSAAPVFSANLVIYGASGNIGSKIVAEALNRGHHVIGVSRKPESLTINHPNFKAVKGDVTDLNSMMEIVTGADAVIMSIRGNGADNSAEEEVDNKASLVYIAAAAKLGNKTPRLLQVGNQATLYRNGVQGLNSGKYEEGTAFYGRVKAHQLVLDNYKAIPGLKWTVLSPSGTIAAGTRTGHYRIGGDEVLTDATGKETGISQEDFAVAFIDEVEKPKAIAKRIAIGY